MQKPLTFNLKYIFGISLISALGGLLFGYDISVISGAIPFITEYFELNDWWKGFAVSSVYIGCIIGAGFSGKLSDTYGRKPLLIISALLFTISAIGSGLAKNLEVFFIYRLIGGFGVGMASLLSPLYIAELAPAKNRGQFVSINQLTIVIGILLAYFVNYLLVGIGSNNWRWMFAAEVIPSLFFFFGMMFVPESPRYLVKAHKPNEAFNILMRIGTISYASDTIKNIEETLSNKTYVSFKTLLKKPLKSVLLIGITLAIFQQWSGINVIFFYAPDIFAATGIGLEGQLGQTVLIGVVNVTFTIVAMFLVDRLGRKTLLLFGSLGMAICYIIIGSLFFIDNINGVGFLIIILLTIAFYAISLAPVTWVIISEIFPNRFRGLAMAIATLFLWLACFLLTLSFPVMMNTLQGSATFWIYAIICILGFIFIWQKVPETKQKTLEELESEI